jgi:hypothetical protein
MNYHRRRIMTKQRTFWLLSILALTCSLVVGTGIAQQSEDISNITGYGGTVSIIPNSSRLETTIALTRSQGSVPEGQSNQIVFHLQADTGGVPLAWQGAAHVLVGDGILAILPDGKVQGMLFKFSSRQLPSSFGKLTLQEFPVYGIARYGENKPLTLQQIDRLARTGSPLEPQ